MVAYETDQCWGTLAGFSARQSDNLVSLVNVSRVGLMAGYLNASLAWFINNFEQTLFRSYQHDVVTLQQIVPKWPSAEFPF